MFNKDGNSGDYIRPSEEYIAGDKELHDEQRSRDERNVLENEIYALLDAGERLLWSEARKKGFSSTVDFIAVAVMIIISLVGFLLAGSLIMILLTELGLSENAAAAAGFAISGTVMAVLLFKCIKETYLDKTVYAITDKNVIYTRAKKMKRYPLDSIIEANYNCSVFNYDEDMGSVIMKLRSDDPDVVCRMAEFVGIKHPGEVYRILSQAIIQSEKINT